MTRYEFEDLLSRYTHSDCTREERILICSWFQKIEFDRDFFLSKEEYAFVETKIQKIIDKKIKENDGDLKSETSFDGFLNTCLIYAGTIETLLLIETLNADLLFT